MAAYKQKIKHFSTSEFIWTRYSTSENVMNEK